MLPQAVYHELYQIGRAGGLIVEVGTALGAAMAALALGLRDGGSAGRVFSFDPMLGGPRRAIARVPDRVTRVRRNLRHFGVDHLVELVTASLPDGRAALPSDRAIDALLLDADGCIDRDLDAVYDRLRPGATIVIDDVRDAVRMERTGFASYRIDAKMRLSWLLVDCLTRCGALSEGHRIKDTVFGSKPLGYDGGIDPRLMVEAYRGLVFTRSRLGPVAVARQLALTRAQAWMPDLLQRARVVRRRAVGQQAARPERAPA